MYELTQEDIDSLQSHRSSQFLPQWKDLPDEFCEGSNVYCKVIEAWYVGEKEPPASYTFNPGFRTEGKQAKKFLMAHLNDFDQDYDLRIAGVAFMLSKIFTIKEKS